MNGSHLSIPPGVGIVDPQESNGFVNAGSCIYPIHAHDTSGIIHMEASQLGTYTLGQFFNIWGETLNDFDMAGNIGNVNASINGASYIGSPRDIAITKYEEVAIEEIPPSSPHLPTLSLRFTNLS